jgi:hypothetical protein
MTDVLVAVVLAAAAAGLGGLVWLCDAVHS